MDLTIYKCFEILAMIFGLAALHAAKPLYVKLIIFLLVLTVFFEVFFIPFSRSHKLLKRNTIYSIFSLVDMLVWLYFFYGINEKIRVKKIVICLGIYLLVHSLIELQIKGWQSIHPDSFRLYELTILIFSMYYLYCILKKQHHKLQTDEKFWFCSACIIFHTIFIINFSTIAETKYWKIKNANEVFDTLRSVAIIGYYSLLCIAFFVCIYNYNQQKRIALSLV